ncbi:hypothetical protein NL676_036019 [Syzygium grande]|nr:hypothetical protein NL676_036019 [Syzygium grande]
MHRWRRGSTSTSSLAHVNVLALSAGVRRRRRSSPARGRAAGRNGGNAGDRSPTLRFEVHRSYLVVLSDLAFRGFGA